MSGGGDMLTIDATMEQGQIGAALRRLEQVDSARRYHVTQALKRCALIAHRESIRNAPISPNESDIKKANKARAEKRQIKRTWEKVWVGTVLEKMKRLKYKTKKAQSNPLTPKQLLNIRKRAARQSARIERGIRKGAKTRRENNPRAIRVVPGGLERSIDWQSNEDRAIIFVDSNAQAGKYAQKIHSEKYVTWSKRGIGTIRKGQRADAWFIARAVRDNAAAFLKIIASEVRKALAEAGGKVGV